MDDGNIFLGAFVVNALGKREVPPLIVGNEITSQG